MLGGAMLATYHANNCGDGDHYGDGYQGNGGLHRYSPDFLTAFGSGLYVTRTFTADGRGDSQTYMHLLIDRNETYTSTSDYTPEFVHG